MSTEIEAKFVVASPGSFDEIRALTRLGSYSLLPGRMQSIHDDYLDTPDRALLAAGYACRRREGDGAIVMTVKSVASSGGNSAAGGEIHRREELEVTIPRDCPPADWPASPAQDTVLQIIGGKELQGLFRLGQERFVRSVVDGDRLVAVSSLDDVSLSAGGVSQTWRELEIELLPTGAETDLLAISGWVRATLGLHPALESKFEKALRMVSAAGVKRTFARRRRLVPPAEKFVVLEAPTDTPGELPIAELAGMGYTARPVRSVTDHVTFYDTHDGAFTKKGFAVSWSRSEGVWRLREDGKTVAEARGEQSTLPLAGDFGAALGTIPASLPTIPLLECSVVDAEYSLAGFAGARLSLRARRWTFQSPLHHGGAPRSLLRLTASGPATTISYFASLLQDRLGFRPSRASVLERGLSLLGIQASGSGAPAEYRVTLQDSVAAACARIFRGEAWRMRMNAPGAIRDLDPEFVHDLRVATRRARSASRLFDSILDPVDLQKLREELQWIARLLGGVRDLDVLAERLDTQVKLAASGAGISEQLRERLALRRERALAELVPALESERFSGLLGLVESAGANSPPGSEVVGNMAAGSFARKRVSRAFRKLAPWIERPADTLTDAELHLVRILFKRLRYTCDFFRPLLGPDAGSLIGAFVAYQDTLGLHQDAATALRILADLLSEVEEKNRTEELLLSMGALLQVQRDAQRVQREKFSRRWESARELITFGKKLRAAPRAAS